eukprot:79598-Chlamydomonas_euryale.AAC.3
MLRAVRSAERGRRHAERAAQVECSAGGRRGASGTHIKRAGGVQQHPRDGTAAAVTAAAATSLGRPHSVWQHVRRTNRCVHERAHVHTPVSYTHLTLPTILLV